MSPCGTLDHVIARMLTTPGWYEERVLPKLVRDASGCLVWTGSRVARGYGHVSASMGGGRHVTFMVHRVVWMKERGPIPLGLVLDHDGPNGCHNRACAEPSHLQVVTHRHNIVVTGTGPAAQNALKVTCSAGHLLSGANLVPCHAAAGFRSCLKCNLEHSREYNRWISQASARLGMSQKAYGAQYGWSRFVAQEIVLASDASAVAA